MKKNIFLFVLMIMFTTCFAMSKFNGEDNSSDIVTGRIKVYGNEPFTFLGIVTEDGLKYTLKAEKKVLDKIQNAQGHLVEIKGKIEIEKDNSGNQIKNSYLIVEDWKIVK